MREDNLVDSFTEWAVQVEPRLRHALTASFGPQSGKEAAADALSQAWEQWDLIKVKDNPLGYVYGIGRNKARRMASRHPPVFFDVPAQRLPQVEPGLPAAIAGLSENQRIAVALLYGYEWTMSGPAAFVYSGVGPFRYRCKQYPSGSECGRYSLADFADQPGGLPDWGDASPGSSYSPDHFGYLTWEPLPAETSIVVFETAEESQWQQPVAGFAMFPSNLADREQFDLTAFDAVGNILIHQTINDPADGRQYPVTGP